MYHATHYALAGLLIALLLAGCGKKEERLALTRDEFKTKVMGKTATEVVEAVGKPHSTTEDARGPDWGYWHYRGETFDTTTGKVDSSVMLSFEKGRVVSVNY